MHAQMSLSSKDAMP